ncbi:hypothetical protein A0256_07660 [Mucilaginibacter sp. PAMC 26640]|nr:hypothetical protein A0256_07660 [Mucilaginibacter sp. PAMC 26640]
MIGYLDRLLFDRIFGLLRFVIRLINNQPLITILKYKLQLPSKRVQMRRLITLYKYVISALRQVIGLKTDSGKAYGQRIKKAGFK